MDIHGDTIPKNLKNSIINLKEAIQQKADRVSMYNLAHLYFYDIKVNNDNYDKSINLLIQSLNLKFEPARHLLYLVLIQKYEHDKNKINEKLKCIELEPNDHVIEHFMFKYNDLYNHYKKVDFLYRYNEKYFLSSLLDKQSYPNQFHGSEKKVISNDFYEGFNS